ncbi:MAG TPA: FAD-dependent oxidoreductase [Dehalococcoidales bacterium]|nr:FAD-dependent oxidoreductase [Dehalococcoidales bacterium]
MAKYFDVIIVGAGPAGSLAALRLARAGLNAVMVERGSHPGAKNMFGGLLHHTPVLNELIPDFPERAPLERHVYKKTLAFLTPEAAVSLAFESEDFENPPHNGYTVFRPVFDKWLAGEAVKEGALLLTECAADDLIKKDGRVVGVTVKGREGELRGNIVIAADGVLSFLAEKAGLRKEFKASDMGVGIKLLLGLPEAAINERFHLVRDEGADISFVGATGGMRGGGFLYTNRESVSVGLVVHLDSLRAAGKAPYDVLNGFLAHPLLKKLLKGAEPLEYSAHLIPEGGYKAIPKVYTDGLMVAGDAAGLVYTNGINLEGINLAMTSGVLAAETAIKALEAGDYSARTLALYRKKLDESFVIRDMKTFKNAAGMMHSERLYESYPKILAGVFEKMYRVDGKPRSKLLRLARREALKEMGLKGIVADGIKIGRALL